MALLGKRATFERLVSDSLPAALRFAVRLTGGVDSAEEVIQEAMVRASRSWKTYRGDAQFRTWLLRIVVNVHRDRIARRNVAEPLDNEVVDAGRPSPVQEAEAGELSDAIAGAIAVLPLRQREVITLSVYEGLAAQEIASVLETSESNVYATLSLVRSKLRKRLAAFLAEK